MKSRILLVEDEIQISELLSEILSNNNYEVDVANDGVEGYSLFKKNEYSLVITDVMMPFKSGIEIIHHAKKHHPDTPIIVLSALGEEEQVVLEAFNLGVADFIPKPFNPNELAIRVKRVLK